MPYTVFASNEPDKELTVGDAEFVDLQRMGLLVPNKGDLNAKGQLKRDVAAEAPLEVTQAVPSTATGAQPTITEGA